MTIPALVLSPVRVMVLNRPRLRVDVGPFFVVFESLFGSLYRMKRPVLRDNIFGYIYLLFARR